MKTPKLSRIAFEFIANTLHHNAPDFSTGTAREIETWKRLVRSFAIELSATNGLFQRDRFLRACEFGGTGRATKNGPVGSL